MLNQTFYIGRGDNADPLVAVIYAEDGVTPVDLTGASITFSMWNELDEVLIDAAHADIVGSPTAGRVRYEWGATDTVNEGTYYGRFHVSWAAPATRFSAPNEGYITIHVT